MPGKELTVAERLDRLERAAAQLYALHSGFQPVALRDRGYDELADLVEPYEAEETAVQAALPPRERDVPFGMPAKR